MLKVNPTWTFLHPIYLMKQGFLLPASSDSIGMNFDSEESQDTLKQENFETKHSKILHESKDKELWTQACRSR